MDKLIYVHVLRLGFCVHLGNGIFSGCDDATNDWYVIKPRSDVRGNCVKMTRVFENVSQLNHPNSTLLNTDCVAIGSHLYVISGRCLKWRTHGYDCDYFGSTAIRCLDTRDPEGGWRTCCTLPSIVMVGRSAVVDGRWLYVFPYTEPWCCGFNVEDGGKSGRKIPKPGERTTAPTFSTCLSPGTLVSYKGRDNTLYQLDCENNAWTLYHKDFLPYSSEELCGCSFAVDDGGILYIYLRRTLMRLISFDIRNKKEIHVVDLPRSSWFGQDDPVQLIVLSKNRFCLLWDRVDAYKDKCRIYYSRFSVSYDDLSDPFIDEEETRSFTVDGCRVLNVVAVDPLADIANGRVDMAGGREKAI